MDALMHKYPTQQMVINQTGKGPNLHSKPIMQAYRKGLDACSGYSNGGSSFDIVNQLQQSTGHQLK